jgi:hypothetical protein
MERDKMITIFYVGASLIVIIVLAMMVKKKEGFKQCVCSSREGGRQQNCQDTVVVDNAYADNILTESTNLKSPGWDRGPSPGDTGFPASTCGGTGLKEHPNFGAWDFTDFGSL